MSSRQKFYLSFSLLVLFLGYASFIGMSYKKEQLSQQVITDIPVLLSSSGNTSSTGIALSASGSHQSGSVSSTGITPKFRKPNTVWKSRTVTLNDGRVLNYEFGNGNPEGADPLSDIELKSYNKCFFNMEVDEMDCPPDANVQGNGYITPMVERDLFDLVSHPAWESILTNCKEQFIENEYPAYSEGDDASYNKIMNHDFINIENFMSVDLDSGRKILTNSYGTFYGWFRNAITQKESIYNDKIMEVNNCITKNGGLELFRLMDYVQQKKFYPLGNFPEYLRFSQKYYLYNGFHK